MNSTPATPATLAIPASPAHGRPPRHNLFAATHKALRLFMADTLGRFGRVSVECCAEVSVASEQLGALLHLCRRHLEQEARFVHPAVEARRPGATHCAAAQNADNLAEIGALQADLDALRAAPSAARAVQVYRHFALFVAASFQHMHLEETSLNEVLCTEYGDPPLRELEQQLLGSDDTAARATLAVWIARAQSAPQPPGHPAAWPVTAAPMAPTGDVRGGDDAETSSP